MTGDNSGVARVWNAATGQAISVLRGHTAGISRARFNADGTHVATVSVDGSARLWRARPATPADPDWQHAESTSFSPDSRHVLAVDGWRRAIWDTQSGSVVPLAGGNNEDGSDSSSWPCGRAAGCSPWSPDGLQVAGANAAGRAVVWDARSGAVQRRLGKASGSVIGATFSADGQRLALVDGNRYRARLWDVEPQQPGPRVPFARAGDYVQSAQFVAGPLRVLTVDAAGAARLSDPVARSSTQLPGVSQPAAVAASEDGRQLAIGTLGGELRVFSGDGSAPRVRRAVDGAVNTVSFDRAGTAIATGGQKGIARIWDIRTLAPTTLSAPGETVTSARFSPDGAFVLVTSGSIARLWDRALERVVLLLPRARYATGEFSPDGRSIAIAGANRLEVHRCYACLPLPALERHGRSRLPAP